MQHRPESLPPFGEQLRHYRERAGLSQAELAELADLSVSAVSALERGVRTHPYPHTVRLLAGALGLSAGERAGFASAGGRSPGQSDEPETRTPHGPSLSTLPVPRTSLVGRSHDLAKLRSLIADPDRGRLVTLIGPGGIGKTRVALQLAVNLGDLFPGGVWFVEFAPIADPASVPKAVAAALNVREIAGVPLGDTLIGFLKPKTALLVLDNCEHVLDISAAFIDQLLTECPALRIIATSRVPLRISGEQQWPLAPLAVPLEDGEQTPARLSDVPAVRLFVQRARTVVPDFRLTDQNAAAVADVCQQLEGIPLALELAAAQVRVLTVDQIAARLTDALALLAGGSRDAPDRQQTMRAALDWSYDLLTERQRLLFQRLSVFRGGCSLEAVEAVCTGDHLPSTDVLGLITQLVDSSLVQVEAIGPESRYLLLEPIRQYAMELLAAAEDVAGVQARHAAFYLSLAERVGPELRGPEQVNWLRRLTLDQGNFDLALHWLSERGEAESGLRLAVCLAPFWAGHGHLGEGRRWLSMMTALPAAHDAPPELLSRALLRAGELAQWQAALDDAIAVLEKSLEMSRDSCDQPAIAEALAWLGAVHRRQGNSAIATDLLQESMALYRTLDDRSGIAFTLLNLGVSVVTDGDVSYGYRLLEESLALYRELGDVRYVSIASTMMGGAARGLGNHKEAAILLREGLSGHLAVGDLAFIDVSLRQVAALTAPTQPEEAARLLGAAETLRESLNAETAPLSRLNDDGTMTNLRAQLSEGVIRTALYEGHGWTKEQATTKALAITDVIAADGG